MSLTCSAPETHNVFPMLLCSRCGVQFDGRFCSGCGAPVVTGRDVNLPAALCYLFGAFSGVVFLLLPPFKVDRAIRFHAFQSIVGTGALLTLYALVALLLPWLLPLTGLASMALWLFVLLKTYQGQKVILPVIGPLILRDIA